MRKIVNTTFFNKSWHGNKSIELRCFALIAADFIASVMDKRNIKSAYSFETFYDDNLKFIEKLAVQTQKEKP